MKLLRALLARPAGLLVAASLAFLYLVWGSTYLALRIAIRVFPPFLLMGTRFALAGAILFAILRLRGVRKPTALQWRAATAAALPLLVCGMGCVSLVAHRVPSGVAALVFGSVPLWTSLLDCLWGGRLRRAEVAGLVAGFSGVLVVALRGTLSADPGAAVMLLMAAASYSLGCVLTRRLPLAPGGMGIASQMIAGGVLLLVLGAGRGERLPAAPGLAPVLALAYLTFFGSMLGYSALGYLLRNTRPALAMSYAFVNPMVALALGSVLAGEAVTGADLVGLALVVSAVATVALASLRTAPSGAVRGVGGRCEPPCLLPDPRSPASLPSPASPA